MSGYANGNHPSNGPRHFTYGEFLEEDNFWIGDTYTARDGTLLYWNGKRFTQEKPEVLSL